MKASRPIVVNRNDREILRFLWKWKMASTAAVFGRFFGPNCRGLQGAYKRLRRLKRLGLAALIDETVFDGHVWTLTKSGFKAIASELPPLYEKGFASEAVRHDLISQAAHLCLWLPGLVRPKDWIFSEQELRRIDPNSLPEWIPPVKWHRPDGYWRIENGGRYRIIALEVELSVKADDEYESIAAFYNESQSIESVLWIVGSTAIKKRIVTQWHKCGPKKDGIYNFVLLDDFLKFGARAEIFEGSHARQTMSEFLIGSQRTQAGYTSDAPWTRDWTQAILDTRLYRIKSITFKQSRSPPETPIVPATPHKLEFDRPNDHKGERI